jgi:hypothetical protein
MYEIKWKKNPNTYEMGWSENPNSIIELVGSKSKNTGSQKVFFCRIQNLKIVGWKLVKNFCTYGQTDKINELNREYFLEMCSIILNWTKLKWH